MRIGGSIFALSSLLLPSAAKGSAVFVSSLTNPIVSTFANSGTFDNSTSYSNNGATFTATATVFMFSVGGPNLADLDPSIFLPGSIFVSLSGLASAFGFDADLPQPPNTGAAFNVTGVKLYSDANRTNLIDTYSTVTAVSSGTTFFGLSDTTAFQSLEIDFDIACNDCGGFSPYLDDFQVQAVPEPGISSLLFLGGGLVLIGAGLRRWR